MININGTNERLITSAFEVPNDYPIAWTSE
jgi:hypothetical protein